VLVKPRANSLWHNQKASQRKQQGLDNGSYIRTCGI